MSFRLKRTLYVISIIAAIAGSSGAQVPSDKQDQLIPPIESKTEAGHESQQKSPSSEVNPPVISSTAKIAVSEKVDSHSEDAQERGDVESSKWADPITWFTLMLVLFTGGLWFSTHRLWRATNTMSQAALGQGEDMKASIAEAVKSAAAMENVATAMIENTVITKGIAEHQKLVSEIQLRAYLTVVVGGAIYQEKERGLRFEAKPTIVNTGVTAAQEVRHRSAAAILPVPLPENFEFPVPEEAKGGSLVGAHQQSTIGVVVDDFVEETEVENIKISDGKGLYVWGIIQYIDIFGEKRETKYAQSLTWLKSGDIYGYYIAGHNKGT